MAADDFETGAETLQRIRDALSDTVVGQDDLISDLLMGFFAPGHVLLEGPPGLGKTHLVKGLSALVSQSCARIQCTPDLMPADITGSETLSTNSGSAQILDFRPGPLFKPIVLVDEINRATPRTQSAFLEAMQEGQVTHQGTAHPLPNPFWVLATQNPIELEGTYPLPEAQLDRFITKILVPYPDADALRRISELTLDSEPTDDLSPAVSETQLDDLLTLISSVLIAPEIRDAAVQLVVATRPDESGHPLAREHVRYGASPRGLQALLRCARVGAMLNGRAHVASADLIRAARPALRHRVLLRFESEIDGFTPDQLIDTFIAESVAQ